MRASTRPPETAAEAAGTMVDVRVATVALLCRAATATRRSFATRGIAPRPAAGVPARPAGGPVHHRLQCLRCGDTALVVFSNVSPPREPAARARSAAPACPPPPRRQPRGRAVRTGCATTRTSDSDTTQLTPLGASAAGRRAARARRWQGRRTTRGHSSWRAAHRRPHRPDGGGPGELNRLVGPRRRRGRS
jgi:hypothetical protein